MEMTETLRKATIDTIHDINSLKLAILRICHDYEAQHPQKSGFFTVRNRHRNHGIARRIARKVSTLKLVPMDYIEKPEDSFPLINDIFQNSGDGSLHRCIFMAIEKLFEVDPDLKAAFDEYRIITALDAMGF